MQLKIHCIEFAGLYMQVIDYYLFFFHFIIWYRVVRTKCSNKWDSDRHQYQLLETSVWCRLLMATMVRFLLQSQTLARTNCLMSQTSLWSQNRNTQTKAIRIRRTNVPIWCWTLIFRTTKRSKTWWPILKMIPSWIFNFNFFGTLPLFIVHS